MNLLQEIEREQVEKLAANRPVPKFQPGDTVRVMVRVVEGERERVQAFEGVCIARKNAGINSNFTSGGMVGSSLISMYASCIMDAVSGPSSMIMSTSSAPTSLTMEGLPKFGDCGLRSIPTPFN